jgi:hypothetical protein
MLLLTSLTGLLPIARKSASPTLSLTTLSPAEREWFLRFKWEHPASPAAMQLMMAKSFGAYRALELVIFFEKTAIPARPGEWRRRMH